MTIMLVFDLYVHLLRYAVWGHQVAQYKETLIYYFQFGLSWGGLRIEPRHEKIYVLSYANNKDADQPAHPRRLISAFAVRCLDGMIPILASIYPKFQDSS